MPASNELTSHWHHSVEGLSTSSLDFFTSIEEALKAKEAPVRTERIELGEGGVLSAKRVYLRVAYERFVFDIGAAPLGKDFFFSWWLGRRSTGSVGCVVLIGLALLLVICVRAAGYFNGVGLFFVFVAGTLAWMQQGGSVGDMTLDDVMLGIPVIGPLYLRFFKPTAYYSEDTRRMFEETVHRVVIEEVSTLIARSRGTRSCSGGGRSAEPSNPALTPRVHTGADRRYRVLLRLGAPRALVANPCAPRAGLSLPSFLSYVSPMLIGES